MYAEKASRGVTRQLSRIFSPSNIRDLCSGEPYHVVLFLVLEKGVEVVKVPPSSTDNYYIFLSHDCLLILVEVDIILLESGL